MRFKGSLILLALLLAALLMVGTASAATLIVKASASDAFVRNSSNETWLAHGSDTFADNIDAAGTTTYIYTSGTSGATDYFNRYGYGILPFDTSGISANTTGTINSVKVHIFGYAKTNKYTTNPNLAIVRAYPADPTSISGSDFNKIDHSFILANNITYAGFSTTGWNTFTFTNISINTTGYTTFAILEDWQQDSNFQGTWATNTSYDYQWISSNGATAANHPYIEISYNVPACPINVGTMFNVTGDGTDEQSKIQAAFDYSEAHSICDIVFPSGKTISINSTLTFPNNTDIFGNGSILKVMDGWTQAGSGADVLDLGSGDVIHDFKIDGNRDTIVPAETVDDVKLEDYVIFEYNEVFNTSDYSVYSYRDNNFIVRHNTIHDGNQYGLECGGSASPHVLSENVTMYNNTIYNLTEVGIKIKGCGNSSIYENNVTVPDSTGSVASGIRLYSADVQNNNVHIYDNIVNGDLTGDRSGTTVGIVADAPPNPNSIIELNTINSTYRGISIASNSTLVKNNTISYSRHTGLYVLSNDNEFYHNILTNAGIILGSASNQASNNIFRYNVIKSTPASTDGARLRYSNNNYNNFDFNSITATAFGININSTYGSANHTIITNNTIVATAGCYLDQGNDTYYYNNTCNAAMDPVIVSFTGVQTIPAVGTKKVVFTDTSTGPTILSWIWNATDVTGNNTPATFSTSQNPTAIFPVGNYSIVLNASAAIEANSTAANAYWVNVSASDSSSVPITDFSANATTVCYGAAVAFTDSSTNVSSWSWAFGDGATSTEQNPTHVYNISSGYFTVALTGSNGIGTDTETKSNYINVQGSCSGGSTVPTARPFSAAIGSSMIVTAMGIIGLAIIGFGVAIVVGALSSQSTDGLVAGIFTIMLGGAILIISYMFLSPIMNLVA